MPDINPEKVRVVARDSRFSLLSAALDRRRYLQRRARMKDEGCPSLAIIPNDEIGIEILQFGVYERRLLSMLFDDVLAPFREDFAQKAVLDIGANIGNHSVYLARRFKHVISFEPGAVPSYLLQANLLLNQITNVDVYKIGLSDQEICASLAPSEADNIGSNTVNTDPDASGGEAIELRCGDRLLEGCADLEPIALVKIDVEGHETKALQGLERTLRKDRPIILFETACKNGPSGSDSHLALLRSFDYRNFYTLAKDFPMPHWRSPLIRAVLRATMGTHYVLEKHECFDDRYYNLAIATADQILV